MTEMLDASRHSVTIESSRLDKSTAVATDVKSPSTMPLSLGLESVPNGKWYDRFNVIQSVFIIFLFLFLLLSLLLLLSFNVNTALLRSVRPRPHEFGSFETAYHTFPFLYFFGVPSTQNQWIRRPKPRFLKPLPSALIESEWTAGLVAN